MKTNANNALEHFRKIDPVLYSLATKNGSSEIIKPRGPDDYFLSLCREIVGQQLAKSAARAIFDRFANLFPNKQVNAQGILRISDETIRNTGMAWSKVRSIKDLAQKVENGILNLRRIKDLDNPAVIEELMQVKGVGPWTAEMFLIFTLGRQDVFSSKDLGLRKAIIKLYKLKREPAQEQLDSITKRWSPYRSYACRILWKSLE